MKNEKGAAARDERHRDTNQGDLYIVAGVPGSGKSTFLKNHILPEEVIVSRDEIRFSVLEDGEEYFSHEAEVFDKFVSEIIKNIKEGRNVYADATHLTPASQIKLLAPILLEAAPPRISYIYFDVPIDVCLERNEKRKGTRAYVPRSVIRRMKETSEFRPCVYIDSTFKIDKDGKVEIVKND